VLVQRIRPARRLWRVPPLGGLQRHLVPLRDLRPGTAGAVVGDVQVDKRGIVRAAEGRLD
jgi:hypothetical protein